MRLPPLILPALLCLVGWGASCSAPPVASRPVPPVKTRPVQEVPLSTGALPAPAEQTETQPPPQGSEVKMHGEEGPLSSERGREGEENEKRQGEFLGLSANTLMYTDSMRMRSVAITNMEW